MAEIDGFVALGFERVQAVFEENFERRGDVGAAFALYHHGELVVDLWGGIRDRDTGEAWEQDTLVRVASSTRRGSAPSAPNS